MGLGVDVVDQTYPCLGGDGEVEEAFDHVVVGDGIAMLLEVCPYFLGGFLGFLLGDFQQGEDHQRQVALEVAFRFLRLQAIGGHFLSVELLHGLYRGLGYLALDVHVLIL